MKVALCGLFILGVAACGRTEPIDPNPYNQEFNIVGGRPVAAGSAIAGHVVAVLGSTDDRGFLCTGVLIADNAVLTAGHCGVDMQRGAILFSTTLSPLKSENMRPIVDAQIEPRFDQTMGRLKRKAGKSPNSIKNWGDLSVLHFSGGLPAGYSPIKIAGDEPLQEGAAVMLAGYGLLNGVEMTPSRQLNAVTVKIQNAKYSAGEFTVDSSQDKGPCHGDSGGPAFLDNGQELILVGITSRGFNGVCTTATVYTRISSFIDWIETAAKI